MSAVVWYLVVAFGQSGGVAMIPQQSREQCVSTAKWIHDHRFEANATLSYAACVPGVSNDGEGQHGK